MQFIPITRDNLLSAIELRPKRNQYKYVRREAVLYSIARAYTARPGEDIHPLLIEHQGQLIGAIRLRNYGHGVGFAAFFIDRRYQGQWLGQQAVEYLIAWVKEHYPAAIEIETAVAPDNAIACRLYERIGFRYTGVTNSSGTCDMELPLR